MTMSRSWRSAVRGFELHRLTRIGTTESFSLRAQLTSTPAPPQAFRKVVHQYTDTLCTTQKQTNLTNSLLQDIAVFSENNSTKLQEWLMDIETAAGLTNES